MGLAGLHPRLTVLQAGPHERPSLTEHLARLVSHAPSTTVDNQVTVVGPDELDGLAQEIARQRVNDHARRRDELVATLRDARELQEAAAARRDEADARASRMAAQLEECDALVEEAAHARTAAEQAARTLDECRAELGAAQQRQALVLDQRDAATRVIEDARAQLQDLAASEMDETTLRRELERTGHELREARAAHDDAAELLQARRTQAYARAEAREQIAHERAELVARLEAPLYDPDPIRTAVSEFDSEIQADHGDPIAQGLAREWVEVCTELQRIEAALPPSPTEEELTTAEHQLGEIESVVAELEATSRHARLDLRAREEIEAAHESVLVAEEAVAQPHPHPEAEYHLEAARRAEHEVLARYGYATYLDVVMDEPEPTDGDAELLDALRARRHAEERVASLWAATEPPQILVTLRTRRGRIYREAAELLCCDPGDDVAELLSAHPIVPPTATQQLAELLARYGVYPVGVSVRDAAIDLLLGIEREIETRDDLVQDGERLDAELMALEDQDAEALDEINELIHSVNAAAAEMETITQELEAFEFELRDRTTSEERRRQRVAAAEEVRAQIAAVSEALERSDEQYDAKVGEAEAAVAEAEIALDEATAGLSHSARAVRRIGEALPPPVRPKATDDPLAELPALREVVASEAERAEAALTSATRELERARHTIRETQAELDHCATQHLTAAVVLDDLRVALDELIGDGELPVLLDDPFTLLTDDERTETLDELVEAASHRPVVLLTDDTSTLGWAIGLPEEVGAVTGLPVDGGMDDGVDGAADRDSGPLPASVTANPPGAVAPSP